MGMDLGGGVTLMNSSTALEAVTRGEIDIQIATAKRFPRVITDFKRTAMALATLDEDTAATMYYRLPRGGKQIEGPSVRLAEVVMHSWGNMRAEARIVSIDESFITVVGTAFDMERNVASRHEVKRRITDSRGKRYNDDMIQNTGNAASSIALREAVFKIVPRSLFKDVFEAAKETSLGKAKTMSQRREAAFGWFEKAGVSRERILARLDRKGMDDVTVDDLLTLTGWRTSIKDGDLQLDEAFAIAGAAPSEKAGAADERLRAAAEARAGAERVEPAPTHPELDAVGMGDPAAPSASVATDPDPLPWEGDAPTAEGSPAHTPQVARLLILANDTKGSGKGEAANDAQRGRLAEAAEHFASIGDADAAASFAALAEDGKLSASQAGRLVLSAMEAGVLAKDVPGASQGAGDAPTNLFG